MYQYRLEVNKDSGNGRHMFVIQSGNPIPREILQVAGLLLDQGLMPTEDLMAQHWPLAVQYVDVVDAREGSQPTELTSLKVSE